MAERRVSRDRRSGGCARRGSSFVEVLLAMTIMALVLVGILQMFSVSLIINKGAAARTQMLFKCQQVVENIRWYYFVTRNNLAVPLGTGIPALADGLIVNLPYDGTPTDQWAFWGPAGANVMETPNGPYQVRYEIHQDPLQNVAPLAAWVVTVSAVPTNVPGATRYFGISTSGSGKRVDYVAQFVQ
jgi:hypothetical protein